MLRKTFVKQTLNLAEEAAVGPGLLQGHRYTLLLDMWLTLKS